MVSEIYETKRPVHQGTDNLLSTKPCYNGKKANFHRFTETKIAENPVGPDDIMSMDEASLMFDLPQTRIVNKTGGNNNFHMCWVDVLHSIWTKASTNGDF